MEANSIQTVYNELVATDVSVEPEKLIVLISGSNKQENEYNEKETHTRYIQIVPAGFPRSQSKGAIISTQAAQNSIPSSLEMDLKLTKTMQLDSLQILGKVFPSSISSLLGAIEKLIKDPYGCFE